MNVASLAAREAACPVRLERASAGASLTPSLTIPTDLPQAEVGFAIGAGTGVAIEPSDVTLIKGSLMGVVTAIEISRATMRNVRQNLVGAFGYNALDIPVAMAKQAGEFGFACPMGMFRGRIIVE